MKRVRLVNRSTCFLLQTGSTTLRQRGFCTSNTLSANLESKVQTLFKNKDLKTSIAEFEKFPTPFDATFLINQRSLPFETSLNVFNRVKDKKKIHPLIAIIAACSRNGKRSEMRQFLKELIAVLNGLDKEQQKSINERVWNNVIVCLTHDDMFEEEAILWFSRYNKHKLGKPDLIVYNSILKVFSKRGNFDKCIEILDAMRHYGIEPDHITFTTLISACAKTQSFEVGKKFHEIVNLNKIESAKLSTTIINFYTKCGQPEIALEIFKELKNKGKAEIVAWNCAIESTIALLGIGGAMKLLDEMRHSGIEPDHITFITLISACAKTQSFEVGKELHEIVKLNKIESVNLSTTIINFYTKCGKPEIALEIFKELKNKGKAGIVAWNCAMESTIELHGVDSAVKLLNEMRHSGFEPNHITFTTLISACAKTQSFEVGKEFHEIVKLNNIESAELSNAIMNFYTKCGQPEIALEIFKELQNRRKTGIVAWNCAIESTIELHGIDSAMKLLDEMRHSGIEPDHITFTTLISACAKTQSFEVGKELHETAKLNKIESVNLSTTIINFYTKCGKPEIALEIFKELKNKGKIGTIAWTCALEASIIALQGMDHTMKLLYEMRHSGFEPNHITFTTLISACAKTQSFEVGQKLHEIVKLNNIDSVELSNAIMNFYTKCGQPEIALEIFKELKNKGKAETVSWTCALEASIVALQDMDRTMKLLDEMRYSGFEPNHITFTTLISACAKTQSFEFGQKLHEIVKLNNIESAELSNAIMNFYTKCGEPEIALEIFKELKNKGKAETVAWNCAMESTIELHGIESAMKLLDEMKKPGIRPDSFTFNILLSACADTVAIGRGKELIEESREYNLEEDEVVKSVRLMFYSNIGELEMSISVFEEMVSNRKPRNVITWNNMLSAYSAHGRGPEVLLLFQQLLESNIQPNVKTYSIVLTGLSHAGMVDEAIEFYSKIKTPNKYHRATMIDVLARSGRMNEAENLIEDANDMIGYMTLMGACRKYNDVKRGERIFEHLKSIEENASYYVLMANIYTYVGELEKAAQVKERMHSLGLKKTPGICYLEHDGVCHEFISCADNHPRSKEIHAEWKRLNKEISEAGYKPDTKWVTRHETLSEEEKKEVLCKHAEKMALAFAFLVDPNRKKIVMRKNLRVCNDCHSATAFISKVKNCEIIVRDTNRYHHFKDGKCSCGDYW